MEDPTTNDTVTTISPLSFYLGNVQQDMTWSMMIFLIYGTFGNLCNCLVFLQKTLRSNPCSHYLLVSSIASLIALLFAVPTGIYAVVGTNAISNSLLYCKFRVYIYHTLLMISRYLIIFACLDRACLSSHRVSIRNFSQIRLARILSAIIIIFWFIAAIHLPLVNTLAAGVCIMPGIYNLLFSIYAVIFAGLIPPISMSIFSLITMHNLHMSHIRIHTTAMQPNQIMRQRDIHLTRMLTAQVVIYLLTTTPYPLNTFYSAITFSVDKSMDRQAIESFIYFITGTFLLFINPSVSFYVYIVTSYAFRKEFKVACRKLWHKISCRHRVNRTTRTINVRAMTDTNRRQQGGFVTSSLQTT